MVVPKLHASLPLMFVCSEHFAIFLFFVGDINDKLFYGWQKQRAQIDRKAKADRDVELLYFG